MKFEVLFGRRSGHLAISSVHSELWIEEISTWMEIDGAVNELIQSNLSTATTNNTMIMVLYRLMIS